jgi:hypothetical protein
MTSASGTAFSRLGVTGRHRHSREWRESVDEFALSYDRRSPWPNGARQGDSDAVGEEPPHGVL